MAYSPIHAQIHDTPEAWLDAATEGIIALFAEVGYEAPEGINIKAHLGFPVKGAYQGKTTGKGRVIGEAHPEEFDGETRTRHLFINPVLSTIIGDKTGSKTKTGEDEREGGVLDVAAHEIAHAIVGNHHGHDKVFTEAIRAIGLAGKPTATFAGSRFITLTARLREALGTYPHAGMDVHTKTQPTRLVKVACVTPFVSEDEDGNEVTMIGCRAVTETGIAKTRGGALNVNITRAWLDEGMAPCCPVCGEQMQEVARKKRVPKKRIPTGA